MKFILIAFYLRLVYAKVIDFPTALFQGGEAGRAVGGGDLSLAWHNIFSKAWTFIAHRIYDLALALSLYLLHWFWVVFRAKPFMCSIIGHNDFAGMLCVWDSVCVCYCVCEWQSFERGFNSYIIPKANTIIKLLQESNNALGKFGKIVFYVYHKINTHMIYNIFNWKLNSIAKLLLIYFEHFVRDRHRKLENFISLRLLCYKIDRCGKIARSEYALWN